MIFKAQQNKPALLDGAVGSLLQTHGIMMHPVLWSSYANISDPKTVTKVHKDYLLAGADVISTNTFRTNPAAYISARIDNDYDQFVRNSVSIAKVLKKEHSFLLAGANASAEDCYRRERTLNRTELEYNHKKHIELLWDSGCDFILNETQSHMDEIEIICRFSSENKIPFVVSLYFTHDLKLLSGEHVEEAVQFIADFKPEMISFNCIKYSQLAELLKHIQAPSKWGFYLNSGKDNQTDAHIETGVFPDEYCAYVEEFLSMKPAMIGSCCGSTPEHTSKLRKMIDERYSD